MINRPQILLTMTAFPWKLPQLLIVILLENQLSNLLKLGQVLKKHCIASHQSTAEVKIKKNKNISLTETVGRHGQ